MRDGLKGLLICGVALGWALACGGSDDADESSEQPAQGQEAQDSGAQDETQADAGTPDGGVGVVDDAGVADAGPAKVLVQTVSCTGSLGNLVMRYRLRRWNDGTADVECSASDPTGGYPGQGSDTRSLPAGFDAVRGICGFAAYPTATGSIGFTRFEGEFTVPTGTSDVKYDGGLEVGVEYGAGADGELRIGDNADRDLRGACADSTQPAEVQ